MPADFLVVLQDGRLKGLRDEVRQLRLFVQDQTEPAWTMHKASLRCHIALNAKQTLCCSRSWQVLQLT